MDRYAIFVDAGYLFASGGELVHNVPHRSRLDVDAAKLLEWLQAVAASHDNSSFLRLYWYDAAINAVPQPEHRRIAEQPGIKLRLGRLTRNGQKGVDSLVVRDMMRLAAEHAISTAYLISGDEDLRQGMIEAQDYGVKVVLIGITGTWGDNVSDTLVWEADGLHELGYDDLADCILLDTGASTRYGGEPGLYINAAPAAEAFAADWVAQASEEDIAGVVASPWVPPHIDSRLVRRVLEDAELTPEDRLDGAVLAEARYAFRQAVMEAVGAARRHESEERTSEAAEQALEPIIGGPAPAATQSAAGAIEPPVAAATPTPPSAAAISPPVAASSEPDPFSPFAIGRRFGISWNAEAPEFERVYVQSEYPRLPQEVDRQLLRRLVTDLGLPAGGLVDDVARKEARAGFWATLGMEAPAPRAPQRPRFEPINESDPYRFGVAFARQWMESAPGDEVEHAVRLAQSRMGLPNNVDRELLRVAATKFGDYIANEDKARLRDGFQAGAVGMG